MKHTLFATLLLAVLLAFCICASLAVRAETKAVQTILSASCAEASCGDFSAAAESLHQAQALWLRQERFYGVVLGHSELDEVNISFAELAQYAALVSKADYLPTAARLLAALDHIREIQLPTCQNLL